MRILLLLMVGCLLATADASADQVKYDDAMRQHENAPAFYLDRVGDLYPPRAVSLDVSKLDWTGYETPNVSSADPSFATLRSLYRWKSTRQADLDWPTLTDYLGVARTGNFDADWDTVQAELRKELAAQLNALGKKHDDLVVLIHGYNNSHEAARQWYGYAEQALQRAAVAHGRDMAIVRMYWDGLDGRTPLFVWGRAQYNGYLVGVELRRTLALLEPGTPLRLFTHSSGAFVVTNALGDGSAGAEPGKLPTEYFGKASGATPGYASPSQLSDLRVAMLIPAQPLHAFSHYLRAGQATQPAIPRRLILGTSKHDLATAKTFLFSCHFKGSTCMAVRVAESCQDVAQDLGIIAPQLQMVTFAGWPVHAHKVKAYINDPEWDQLTNALLADEPGMADGTRRYCPTKLHEVTAHTR